jgi:hypothetical protein
MRALVVKLDLISASLGEVPLRLAYHANKLVYGWRFGQNHDAAFASCARPQGGDSESPPKQWTPLLSS